MGPDFRVLVRRARKAAQEYYLQYVDKVPMTQLVREVGAVMQEFTQSGYLVLSEAMLHFFLFALGGNFARLVC